MRTAVYVLGRGKFAQTIIEQLPRVAKDSAGTALEVSSFSIDSDAKLDAESAVFLHVGSGRELPALFERATQLGAPIIQASTGMDLSFLPNKPGIVFLEAPNVSIPIVKFMYALETIGPLFRNEKIDIRESHQQTKTSVPGTAKAICDSLGVAIDSLQSVRDPEVQKKEFSVPDEHLAGHAIHRITVESQGAELSFGTRVLGRETYIHGIYTLLGVVDKLKPNTYFVTDLVKQGLL